MTTEGRQCAHAKEVKERKNLQYVLAGILFILGLGYVYYVPPFEAPDEPAHFLRAWSVAELQWVMHDHPHNVAGYIVDQMSQRYKADQNALLADLAKEVQKKKARIPNFAFNTSLYPPLPYAFQAIAISLLKDKVSFTAIFYTLRIINITLYTLAFFFFFKRLSHFQWPVFVIACTPMALSQAAMISLDGMVLSAVVIMLAVSLSPQLKIDGLLLIFAILCLGLSKSTYMILALFPLVPLFMRKRLRLPYIFGFLLTISLIMVWNYYLDKENVYDMFVYFVQNYAFRNVDPILQLENVLAHPIDFIRITLLSLINNTILYGKQFVGVLGWLNVHLYVWVYFVWMIMIIVSVFTVYKSQTKNEIITSIYGILLSLISIIGIFFSLYIIWMPVGAQTIEIQGRYLHASFLVFITSLVFVMPYMNKVTEVTRYVIPLLSVVINIASIISVNMIYN